MSRGRLLVVDDEPGMRDMLAFELDLEGFSVTTAASGEAAVQLARAHKYDLAITDLKMPGMDGVATLTALKKMDPDLEVIVATGYATIETAIACMRLGAYDYIQKPYNLTELGFMLDHALEKSHLQGIVALYEASRALLTTLEPEALVKLVLGLARRVLRSDVSAILLVRPGQDEMEVAMDGDRQPSEAYLRDIAARAIAARDPVRVPDPGATGGEPLPIGSDGFQSLIACPLIIADQPLGALVLLRGETMPPYTTSESQRAAVFAAQVALALETAQVVHDLQDANARLQVLDRLKDEFVSMVSHELRTPLNSILGFAEILRDGLTGPLNEEQIESVDVIRGSGRALLALINDLLDFAKIRAGMLTIRPEAVRLGQVLAEVLLAIRPLAQEKRLQVETRVIDDVPEVQADPQRLRQVLLNLLSNAVKFTPEDGRIDVQVSQSGDRLEVSVADTGCGISPDALERIFDPFHQEERSSRRQQEGTGLGLAITRRLIELHGGIVRVESEPGRGSKFTVELPLTLALEKVNP